MKDGSNAICTKSLKAKEENLHLDTFIVVEKMSVSFKIEKSFSDSEK